MHVIGTLIVAGFQRAHPSIAPENTDNRRKLLGNGCDVAFVVGKHK